MITIPVESIVRGLGHGSSVVEESWICTTHPRVFYRDSGSKFDRGEFGAAVVVADAFPAYVVVISMGPYRFYDVKYSVNKEKRIIALDFYSVNPGLTFMPEVIAELEAVGV